MRKLRLILISFAVLYPVIAIAGRTVLTNTNPTVTTNSTISLAANNSRNYLHVQNLSNTPVYCKFGATAVVGQGFLISTATTPFRLELVDKVPIAALNCIAASDGNSMTLLINEGTGP